MPTETKQRPPIDSEPLQKLSTEAKTSSFQSQQQPKAASKSDKEATTPHKSRSQAKYQLPDAETAKNIQKQIVVPKLIGKYVSNFMSAIRFVRNSKKLLAVELTGAYTKPSIQTPEKVWPSSSSG